MTPTAGSSVARILRVWLALLLVIAQTVSSPAAYALKAQAPGENAGALGLEEELRRASAPAPGLEERPNGRGVAARQSWIERFERVTLGHRLAMTVMTPPRGPSFAIAAEWSDMGSFERRVVPVTNESLRAINLDRGVEFPLITMGDLGGPRALAAHPGTDRLYVAQFRSGRVMELTVWSRARSKVVEPRVVVERVDHPSALAVDADAGVLYVAEAQALQIRAFSLADGTPTGFRVPTAGTCEDLVLHEDPRDPSRTILYIADPGAGAVFGVDAATGQPTDFRVEGLQDPRKLAIDPDHRLLFVVSGTDGFLGGFRTDTSEPVSLTVAEAERQYYERHVAALDVDFQAAQDVIYDPHLQALVLITHQQLIPFWPIGDAIHLSPPLPEARARSAAPAGTILIVHPDPAVQSLCFQRAYAAVTAAGYPWPRRVRIYAVGDATTAEQVMAGTSPGLVVTAANLQAGGSGYRVVQAALRRTPPPEILLTAATRPDDLPWLSPDGPVQFVPVPAGAAPDVTNAVRRFVQTISTGSYADLAVASRLGPAFRILTTKSGAVIYGPHNDFDHPADFQVVVTGAGTPAAPWNIVPIYRDSDGIADRVRDLARAAIPAVQALGDRTQDDAGPLRRQDLVAYVFDEANRGHSTLELLAFLAVADGEDRLFRQGKTPLDLARIEESLGGLEEDDTADALPGLKGVGPFQPIPDPASPSAWLKACRLKDSSGASVYEVLYVDTENQSVVIRQVTPPLTTPLRQSGFERRSWTALRDWQYAPLQGTPEQWQNSVGQGLQWMATPGHLSPKLISADIQSLMGSTTRWCQSPHRKHEGEALTLAWDAQARRVWRDLAPLPGQSAFPWSDGAEPLAHAAWHLARALNQFLAASEGLEEGHAITDLLKTARPAPGLSDVRMAPFPVPADIAAEIQVGRATTRGSSAPQLQVYDTDVYYLLLSRSLVQIGNRYADVTAPAVFRVPAGVSHRIMAKDSSLPAMFLVVRPREMGFKIAPHGHESIGANRSAADLSIPDVLAGEVALGRPGGPQLSVQRYHATADSAPEIPAADAPRLLVMTRGEMMLQVSDTTPTIAEGVAILLPAGPGIEVLPTGSVNAVLLTLPTGLFAPAEDGERVSPDALKQGDQVVNPTRSLTGRFRVGRIAEGIVPLTSFDKGATSTTHQVELRAMHHDGLRRLSPGLEEIAEIGQGIGKAQVFGVMVFDTADQAAAAGTLLLDHGVIPEAPYRLEDETIVDDAIGRLVGPASAQGLSVAAGTIRSRAQAQRAMAAGARILVSPGWFEEAEQVWREAWRRGVLFMPGVGSVAEAEAAVAVARTIGIPDDQIYLKVFPALYQGPTGFRTEIWGPTPAARRAYLTTEHLRLVPQARGLSAATFTAINRFLAVVGSGVDSFAVPVGEGQWFDGRELIRAITAQFPQVHLIPTSGQFTPEHLPWVGRGHHIDAIGLLIRANQAGGPDSAEVRAPRIAAVRRAPVAIKDFHAVIVDDTPQDRELNREAVIAAAASRPGTDDFDPASQIHEYDGPASATAGLQVLQARGVVPSLVLLDLNMQARGDGFRLARTLREMAPQALSVLVSHPTNQQSAIAEAVARGDLAEFVPKSPSSALPLAVARAFDTLLVPAGLEDTSETAQDLDRLAQCFEALGPFPLDRLGTIKTVGRKRLVKRLVVAVEVAPGDRGEQVRTVRVIVGGDGRGLPHLEGTKIRLRNGLPSRTARLQHVESTGAIAEFSNVPVMNGNGDPLRWHLELATGLEERALKDLKNPITAIQFVNGGAALLAVDEGGQVVSRWSFGRKASAVATPSYLRDVKSQSLNASVAAISADGEVAAFGDRGVSDETGEVVRDAIWLHRYDLAPLAWRDRARVFGQVTRLAVDGRRRFAAATGGAKPGLQLVSETAIGRSKGVEAQVTALAFDPASTLLAAGLATGRLSVWRVPADTVELTAPDAVAWTDLAGAAVSSVAFAPGGRVVAGLSDGRVQVRRADGTLAQELPRLSEPVTALAVRQDGLIYAAAGRGVWRWDPATTDPAGALNPAATRVVSDRPALVRRLALSPDGRTLAIVVDRTVSLYPLAAGLEEPTLDQRQAKALAALEAVQRAAQAEGLTAPTNTFYFLRDDAVLLAPVFERLGLRFLVRVETSRTAKALVRLGVPVDRIAGATSDEQFAEDYQLQGVTRTAKAIWGDQRFLETVHRPMDPWTFSSVRTVPRIPDSDAAWVVFWHDWPVPDAVRAQLTPAIQATEAYFQAMG